MKNWRPEVQKNRHTPAYNPHNHLRLTSFASHYGAHRRLMTTLHRYQSSATFSSLPADSCHPSRTYSTPSLISPPAKSPRYNKTNIAPLCSCFATVARTFWTKILCTQRLFLKMLGHCWIERYYFLVGDWYFPPKKNL